MKAITPENEMPPAHSTAASGTFPTEQTNASAATTGPSTTFSASLQPLDASVMNKPLKNDIGSSAMKPAMRNPAAISRQSISQSPRKLCATSDQASTDVTRCRQEAASVSAIGCWCPV